MYMQNAYFIILFFLFGLCAAYVCITMMIYGLMRAAGGACNKCPTRTWQRVYHLRASVDNMP